MCGARRVTVRSQEFVPYGVTEDGSAARNAYTLHLQGYLAAALLPIFGAWAGEMPAHLAKARARRLFCAYHALPCKQVCHAWSMPSQLLMDLMGLLSCM